MNRRISQDNAVESAGRTVILALLTGVGLGIGFLLVNKIAKKVAK